MSLSNYLKESAEALEKAMTHPGPKRVEEAARLVVSALQQDKPLLVCGNGGSASDAMHITGALEQSLYRLDPWRN